MGEVLRTSAAPLAPTVCTFCRDVDEVVRTSAALLTPTACTFCRDVGEVVRTLPAIVRHGFARGHEGPGISAASSTTARSALAQHAWRLGHLHALHLEAQLCQDFKDTSNPNMPSANTCAYVVCTRPGRKSALIPIVRIDIQGDVRDSATTHMQKAVNAVSKKNKHCEFVYGSSKLNLLRLPFFRNRKGSTRRLLLQRPSLQPTPTTSSRKNS
ncbi:hypothetical protein F511_40620 [Dorcoceras hygrometricum]|uniref:Uncharacterized protein n=1 Tax=Dorcoceras hygrometricum TaxID=472368 RepID=A0A2Z7B7M1_9LAMI|nr:hypothetical protein F511_40620 [Dorcoceras hygrometricum]